MAKHLIGVISDTHNLLRPEAVETLAGVDLIIHAGDICNAEILEDLRKIGPVIAVSGNNDTGLWTETIPVFKVVKVAEISIFVIHNIKEMEINPSEAGINVVISGHSHKSYIEKRNDILYLNPGSAGRKRFSLPVSLARLKIDGKEIEAEIIELQV